MTETQRRDVIRTPPKDKKSGKDDPKKKDPTRTKDDGGGGGGGDTVSGAEKRAVAREDALRKKAGLRYNQAAIDLKYQIKPLKDAIKNEFKRSRNQNLADIDLMLTQQLGLLRQDAARSGNVFLSAALDNEMAAGDTQEGGVRNLVRERADSMTAILEQGAGETDALRAMLSAARNWHANASQANRAYYDTAASINAGITDLNKDTRTALANAQNTAEGQREAVWQDFYNRRSEALTQLGNVYGQQRQYMQQAEEMGLPMGKVRKKRMSDAEKGMEKAFRDSANELGKSYEQKALPEWITEWEGTQQVERRQENTNLAAAVGFQPVKKAEGATLRKWAA